MTDFLPKILVGLLCKYFCLKSSFLSKGDLNWTQIQPGCCSAPLTLFASEAQTASCCHCSAVIAHRIHKGKMSLWKLVSLFLCFVVPTKIILTRNKAVEHHWAEKETFSNPDNLVEIVVVPDLSPGVKVIMITAIIIAVLIISNNIRKCFFLFFWENVYSESPSYILNTHSVSMYNNSLYIPHKAPSSVQPSVCWAVFSLIISKVRAENFAIGLHFTISLTPFIFLPARRKIGGGGWKCVLWSMQGLKVAWRDIFWINSGHVKPKSIRISSKKITGGDY